MEQRSRRVAGRRCIYGQRRVKRVIDFRTDGGTQAIVDGNETEQGDGKETPAFDKQDDKVKKAVFMFFAGGRYGGVWRAAQFQDTVFQINIRVYAFAKQAFGRYFELGQNGLHHAFFLLKTRFLAIAVISSMPLILAPIKKVASPIVPIAASLRIKIPMWGVGKQRFSAACVP